MKTVIYDWRVIAKDDDSMQVAYAREGFTTICVNMELPIVPETCEEVVKRHAPALSAWEENSFFSMPETMPGGESGKFAAETHVQKSSEVKTVDETSIAVSAIRTMKAVK